MLMMKFRIPKNLTSGPVFDGTSVKEQRGERCELPEERGKLLIRGASNLVHRSEVEVAVNSSAGVNAGR